MLAAAAKLEIATVSLVFLTLAQLFRPGMARRLANGSRKTQENCGFVLKRLGHSLSRLGLGLGVPLKGSMGLKGIAQAFRFRFRF